MYRNKVEDFYMPTIDDVKDLTSILLRNCHSYYDLDSPIISDFEYDQMFDRLKQMEEDVGFRMCNSPTIKVQGKPIESLAKVKHSSLMLSADKTTNINDVMKFIGDKPVVLSYKLDGATVVLRYENGKFIRAITRGDGLVGEDITHTAKTIKNLPLTIPYTGYLEIRGEALIPYLEYNEMNVDGLMGHPRNVVSGALRQLDPNVASSKHICFYAFTVVNWSELQDVTTKKESLDFLCRIGFDVVPNSLVYYNNIESEIKRFDRKSYTNPTDGWCFEYNDLRYGDSLGSTGHHDRKLFALKPDLESYKTHFRGVSYNTCRTGMVSLTAEFDPVVIDNTTVSRATLHNVDFFNALSLGIGDEIEVAKMNCIIPGVVKNNTKSGTCKLTDRCPTCGEKLKVVNTGTANFLYCPNELCSSRVLSCLTHFCSKGAMNIDGVSERILDFLLTNEFISNFESLYTLKLYKEKLEVLPGFGKSSVKKILESIEKSKATNLARYIYAFGIPDIGNTSSKLLAEHFEYDWNNFYTAVKSGFDYSGIPNFGKSNYTNLIEWSKNNIERFNRFSRIFTFEKPIASTIKDGVFSGRVIVVTGSLNNFTRSTISEKIESVGARVGSSVNSKTDYLLTNDGDSGSSKTIAAKKFGVKVISEEEFIRMCEN